MKILFLFALLLASSSSRADTIDRINQCRASGQSSCIFDLLIEMDAKIRQGGGHEHTLLLPGNYHKTSGNCCDIFRVVSHNADLLSLTLCSQTFSYACRGTECSSQDGANNYRVSITSSTSFRHSDTNGSVCEFAL